MNDDCRKHLDVINQQIKDVIGLYRNAVSRLGMSENELWIWYTLIIMDGDYSQQDICGIWSLSKQTVNTIISKMVRKGFARLETVPGTRNRKVIRLTKDGEVYGESKVRPLFEVEQRAINRLSVEERSACTQAFKKYIDFLREEMLGMSGCAHGRA